MSTVNTTILLNHIYIYIYTYVRTPEPRAPLPTSPHPGGWGWGQKQCNREHWSPQISSQHSWSPRMNRLWTWYTSTNKRAIYRTLMRLMLLSRNTAQTPKPSRVASRQQRVLLPPCRTSTSRKTPTDIRTPVWSSWPTCRCALNHLTSWAPRTRVTQTLTKITNNSDRTDCFLT